MPADDNQTLDPGKFWRTVYTVDANDNGTLKFVFSGNDSAGNGLRIDNASLPKIALTDLGSDGLSFSRYDNHTISADTKAPVVSGIVLKEDQSQSLIPYDPLKYDNQSVYVVKKDDYLVLTFRTDEKVDQPQVTLRIGDQEVSPTITDNSSSSTNDSGRNWKASYRISDNDSGVLDWLISGTDRAGNSFVLDI